MNTEENNSPVMSESDEMDAPVRESGSSNQPNEQREHNESMSDQGSDAEKATETDVVAAAHQRFSNDPKQFSPRRRMQELLAIPDSQRSDAQWDELIELEIQMAPGNRVSSPDQSMRQNPNPSTGRQPRSQGASRSPQGGPRPQGGQRASGPSGPPGAPGAPGGKKPFKKFRKGPRPGPQGGGSGGGVPSGGSTGE
jgi:hypothetical protein